MLVSTDDLDPDTILNNWLDVDYGRRLYRRWRINKRGAVKIYGKQTSCLVHDISPAGASIEFDGSEKPAVNDKIVLQLEGFTPLVAEVRNDIHDKLGLAFLHGADGQQALALWLTKEENTRRQHRRVDIVCDATIYADQQTYPSVTRNVSVGGAKIEGENFAPINPGDEVTLEFDEIGPIQGIVRYNIQQSIGMTFRHDSETLKTLIAWIRESRETVDSDTG